ncbi:MAG: AzlC family ABC transporter permease [Hydrogenophaga sp.]|jgi:predicted branched-subunit amino acid permease|uniref:AzlC family ABC transporter permease n=1 Tax=Hydrogenophaga sp. TaxID=1904254 RepID=UPI000EC381FE|nr:AzlC family ABC transporter permease [Hydrogenophaga sp.]MDD3786403.1 AzlC family ABC transporter permease [Hydrogenophaga sp.]MDX9969378.1 AzlC family ABC transporter permease [Hydrogenophaga sp.]HAJ11853.1 branched-chain amino acid ABC transporter permease [Comamonadaceae bacterium]
MFWQATHRRYPEYRVGARDMLTAAAGIAAWGLMTGVAMVTAGLSQLEAILMTFIVFAGSAQLTAVPMIAAGAPLWVIVVAAFCVNLRFVVFSAHLQPYLAHLPRWQRVVTGYVTGDLSYVFFARRYPRPGRDDDERARQHAYLMGNCALNYLSWMGASVLGILLSHVIPIEWGLGFAGILALVGLTCSLATSPLRVVAAGVSGTAAVVAWALPLKLNVLVAIVCAVAMCLLLEHTPLRRHEQGGHA